MARLYKFLISPNHILYGTSPLVEELALTATEDVMSSFRALRSLWRRHHLSRLVYRDLLTGRAWNIGVAMRVSRD